MGTGGQRILLCLGAGEQQLALIQKGRELGYEVAAIDRNPKAPGLSQAHIRIVHSASDASGIHRELERRRLLHRIAGVVTRSHGPVVAALAELADKLHLPGPGRGVPELFSDKLRFKTLLEDHGLPLPRRFRFRTPNERQEFLDEAGWILARPVRGHAKQGLELLRSRQEKENFLKYHPVDDGSILLEEYITGPECTVMGWVDEGRFEVVTILDKITSSRPPWHIELGHAFPSEIWTESLQGKIKQTLQSICEVTGLRTAPIIAEFLLKESTPFLVEAAPEVGGEYLVDVLIPAAFPDTDYFADLIRASVKREASREALSKKTPFSFPGSPVHCVRISFLPPQEGRLTRLCFPDELKASPYYLFHKALQALPSSIRLEKANLARLGVFALSAPNTKENRRILKKLSSEFVKKTRIYFEPPVL